VLSSLCPALSVSAFESLGAFEVAVNDAVSRHQAIDIDCSGIRSLSIAAMRILERASHHTAVKLSRAPPLVCLFAAVFELPVTPARLL
jgi:hypothetical protein